MASVLIILKNGTANGTEETLQWRHNGRDGVSNHQPHDFLLSRSFRAQIKESIKAPRHWPLWGKFTGERRKCFHVLTSSWIGLVTPTPPCIQGHIYTCTTDQYYSFGDRKISPKHTNCLIMTQIAFISPFKRNRLAFNSSPPSGAHLRQWIGSLLVEIMACRLFGAKPLSQPMLG